MPVLSDRFSAYPVSVTLNGSGDGTVQFQATGKNIRVTNLYVSVSTRTLQATCTMYKGQIGAQYAIKSTNSGSTGAAAAGSIDLLDGESLYVVWDGGDAGAIATATFTGIALPFDQTPEAGTNFLWDDPIAAGDGSLIYPGLQSINYVAGVSGWRIERDGDAEFNNITARGDIIVAGSDGSEVRIESSGNGSISFSPPPAVGQVLTVPGSLSSGWGPNYMFMTMNTPDGTLGGNPVDSGSLFIGSSLADGTPYPGFNEDNPLLEFNGDLLVNGGNIRMVGDITNMVDENVYLRGETGEHTFSLSAVSSATVSIVFANPFPITVTPMVSTNIDNGAAGFARWGSRGIAVGPSGFTLFVFKGDAGDPAATGNLKVLWSAMTEKSV
jgi:hypothetical protein